MTEVAATCPMVPLVIDTETRMQQISTDCFPETAVHAVPSTEMVQISKDWLSPRDVLEMCNSRSIHYETCQVDTL